MLEKATAALKKTLLERFGEELEISPDISSLDELARIANHRSHRRFSSRLISPEILRLLCACALSAPSKSDLQQCDIVVVSDATKQRAIGAKIPEYPWIATAPALLIFVGNGSRLKAISKLRNKPFPNDHLDLFFNAAVDTGIVLATFIQATEAAGLGCCPISAIRDHCDFINGLLQLPENVFPVAGLAVGWPAQTGEISPRLSLKTTIVENNYEARDLAAEIDDYDRRRAKLRPHGKQRHVARWGEAPMYGWSEDKARQYAEPLRTDFGAFARKKGFRLD
jgi:nitroreductase